MDNSNSHTDGKITEFPICQFYIVLGKHDQQFKNSKKNKYFPISGDEDIKLIQYAVNMEYKKKVKEGYAVASEIVFLIPSIDYYDAAKLLMDKLNYNGTIRVVPSRKKEVEKPILVEKENINDNVVKKSDGIRTLEQNTLPLEQVNEPVKVADDNFDIQKEAPEYHYQSSFDISQIDFDNQDGDHIKVDDSSTYSQDSIDYEKMDSDLGNSSSKKLIKVKTTNKSTAFVDLPVIIFILSALFLIGSIILLFVLK